VEFFQVSTLKINEFKKNWKNFWNLSHFLISVEEIEIEDNEETSEKNCAIKKPQIIAKAYSALTIENAAQQLFTVLRNKNNSKLNAVSIQDILNEIEIRNTEVNEVFTILMRGLSYH
jgi:hypothetical protein